MEHPHTKEITEFIHEKYGNVNDFMNECLPDGGNSELSNACSEGNINGGHNDSDFEPGSQFRNSASYTGTCNDSMFETSYDSESQNDDSLPIKTERNVDDTLYGRRCYSETKNQNEESLYNSSLSTNYDQASFPVHNEIGDNSSYQSLTNINEVQIQEKSNLKMKLYICYECNQICRSAWKLMTHVRKMHSADHQYVCPDCGFSRTDKKQMKKHFRTHSINETKSFHCSVCQKKFGTSSKLKTHMMKHKGYRPYTCGLCSKSFIWSGGLRDHLKIHTGERPFSCKFCSKTFPDTSKLKNHQRIHTGERPHVCQICGKGFIESGKLKRHLRTHTGEQPYKCDFCGRGFNVISNLHKHMSIHSGEKPFVCNVCGRGFSQNVNLKSHSRIHTGEKDPYKCEPCGMRFGRLSQVKEHKCEGKPIQIQPIVEKKPKEPKPKVSRKGMKYNKTKKGNNSENRTKGNNSETRRKGNNSKTKRKGKNSKTLTRNNDLLQAVEAAVMSEMLLGDHLPAEDLEMCNMENNIQDGCRSYKVEGYSDNEENIEEYLSEQEESENDDHNEEYEDFRHDKVLEIDNFDEEVLDFREEGKIGKDDNIDNVEDINKTGDSVLIKDVSNFGKAPDTDINLKGDEEEILKQMEDEVSEMIRTQNQFNTQEYSCQFCGKSFRERTRLRKHEKIHSGVRPHVCKFCGKSFVENSKLTLHLRTHSGEKPYQCQLCPKKFSVISNLHKHTAIHSDVKPFSCNVCGRGFTQNVNLKNHMRIHTGEKDPYKCDVCKTRFSRIDGARSHVCPGPPSTTEDQIKPNTTRDQIKKKTKQNASHKKKIKRADRNMHMVISELANGKSNDTNIQDTINSEKMAGIENDPDGIVLDKEGSCQMQNIFDEHQGLKAGINTDSNIDDPYFFDNAWNVPFGNESNIAINDEYDIRIKTEFQDTEYE